jgi:hypothetical protein
MAWAPDRELNPQYNDISDVERYGASIAHAHPSTGAKCEGFVTFDGDVQRQLSAGRPRWTVESWEPLTLSPSVLCTTCGDHGWVRGGSWVPG